MVRDRNLALMDNSVVNVTCNIVNDTMWLRVVKMDDLDFTLIIFFSSEEYSECHLLFLEIVKYCEILFCRALY